MVNTRAMLFTGAVTVPPPGDRKADPGFGEPTRGSESTICRGCVLAALRRQRELQDVGDVLRDLVAGGVTADDEVFGCGFVRVVYGVRLRVMLPGRVYSGGGPGLSSAWPKADCFSDHLGFCRHSPF